MYVKHPAVRYLEPNSGYERDNQLVAIKLTSVLPEESLLVRLRTYATENKLSRIVYQWTREEIFFVDQQTLVVKIPPLRLLNLSDKNRILVFEVSLNNGV